MLIGVQLPEVERPVTWAEIRHVARVAEASGLDSVWVGDHLLYRDGGETRGPYEAWSLLAGLAEATERVSIGPLVASTSFHSPAMLAKKAATVDDMSGGRLILGLGAGWNRVEYDAFGFAFDNRVDRFEEAFTVIRTLLREGAIDFEGTYYTARESELIPRPRPDISLMVGSTGPRMLRITMPHVDMWNTWHTDFSNDPAHLGPLLENVDAACAEVGRDSAEVVRTVALYVQLPGGKGRRAGSSERPQVEPVPVSRLPEAVASLESQGVGHVMLVLDPIDAASVEPVAETLGRV